ncbi:MAG: hypothetical protein Kow00107_04670 [Planctomycetota bacterium]
MSERLEDKLKKMIVERLFLTVSPEEIGDDDNLLTEFGLDSIKLFELSIGLESEFDLDLSTLDFDLEKFSTVSRLAAIVRQLQG